MYFLFIAVLKLTHCSGLQGGSGVESLPGIGEGSIPNTTIIKTCCLYYLMASFYGHVAFYYINI